MRAHRRTVTQQARRNWTIMKHLGLGGGGNFLDNSQTRPFCFGNLDRSCYRIDLLPAICVSKWKQQYLAGTLIVMSGLLRNGPAGTRNEALFLSHVRESGFRYPEKFFFWNIDLESLALESKVQLKEFETGIQNPSSTDKDWSTCPQYLKSGIQNPKL